MAKIILVLTLTVTTLVCKAELSTGTKESLAAYLNSAMAITELTIEEWGSAKEALAHSEVIKTRCLPVARVLLAKHTSDYEAGRAKSKRVPKSMLISCMS